MNKKILLGLILGCLNSFAVGSSNDIDQRFYNNILSNLDNPYRIITIKKESLNNVERTVINYAIRNFKKDFVECNGKSYIRGIDKVYYVVDYKPTILFRTFPTINKADKLNGVVWRGDILIFLSGNKGEGVAQEVKATDHQSSKWQDMNRLRLSQFGNFEDVYRGTLVFYKNEIRTYYGDGIGNTKSNDNNQLVCSDINQLLMPEQKHETNIESEKKLNLDGKVSWRTYPKIRLSQPDLLGVTNSNVIVRVDVDVKGRISAKILETSGDDQVDKKIVKAVEAAKFNKYTENGEPAAFYIELPFNLS
ncbi:hypothetical protein GCM10023206_07120 [Acinetobacter puyangensis]|uniref:TonB family C-terminal domain-containing protein n=1 Tax=Acinetobacter puyangensis TaxID=1096779 RepID=A0A240E624_9GAMM|nr:TonB family protein [Acinetobacter puyangensis]SNX44208.1 TonB family C-terminal domain-containing protein [Acinetobacter puyangensis]